MAQAMKQSGRFSGREFPIAMAGKPFALHFTITIVIDNVAITTDTGETGYGE